MLRNFVTHLNYYLFYKKDMKFFLIIIFHINHGFDVIDIFREFCVGVPSYGLMIYHF